MDDIRILTEKDKEEITKEIDKVFQSGVESNKILVDALNSKEVAASTSDTIRVNVNKVNDISGGDYNAGDVISISEVKAVYKERFGDSPYKESGNWHIDSLVGDDIYSIAVGGGNTYVGGDGGLHKLGKNQFMWKGLAVQGTVTSVALDTNPDEKYVYAGMYTGEVHKVDLEGKPIWESSEFSEGILGMAAKDGYVYFGGLDNKLIKLSPQGKKLWEFAVNSEAILSVVEAGGYIYICDYDNTITKITPEGKKVWATKVSGFAGHISISEGYIYCGSDEYIAKLNTDGDVVWEKRIDLQITSIVADGDDIYYTGVGTNDELSKVNTEGEVIWSIKNDSHDYPSLVLDRELLYYAKKRGKIEVLEVRELAGYKLLEKE